MKFAIMQWVGKSAHPDSIYAALDADNPAQLPMIDSSGFWSDFKRVDEHRFALAAEAKQAIADQGYYLMGAGVTVTETFGA